MEHAEHRHTPAGTPPAQRERPAPGADENPAGSPAPGAGAEPAENAAPGPLPAPGSAAPTGRQNSAPALRAVCVLAGTAAVLSALALGCAAALCLRLWPLGSQAENTPGGALAAGAPAQQPAENDGPASLPGLPESGPPAQQSAADPPAAECPAGEYQQLWPELYVTPPRTVEPAEKSVALSCDDGPSANTAGILQTLAQHDAKAAWFVTGGSIAGREAELCAIAGAGHALGLHSSTHDYKTIYASVDSFLADMAALSAQVAGLTGVQCALVRFPGGSINAYNAGLYQPLCAEVLRRGYRYYDWNASAQDAVSPQRSADEIARRVIDGVHANRWSVVLLHDTKSHTAQALPQILETLAGEGYTFAALDPSVPMVSFGYGD